MTSETLIVSIIFVLAQKRPFPWKLSEDHSAVREQGLFYLLSYFVEVFFQGHVRKMRGWEWRRDKSSTFCGRSNLSLCIPFKEQSLVTSLPFVTQATIPGLRRQPGKEAPLIVRRSSKEGWQTCKNWHREARGNSWRVRSRLVLPTLF